MIPSQISGKLLLSFHSYNLVTKLFKSIVTDFLYTDFSNIIIADQHGLMKNRSVESNIFIFTDYILVNMAKDNQVDPVYTDFSRAFDKIDHTILLCKRAAVGAHDGQLEWLKFYTYNRLQAVVVGKYRSQFILTASGVPQGSHLDRLLFKLNINDINICFNNNKFFIYTDDVKISIRV